MSETPDIQPDQVPPDANLPSPEGQPQDIVPVVEVKY